MPRPKKSRHVCNEPVFDTFLPDGSTQAEAVVLSVDEYEVFRLLDYEQITQKECAMQMKVARTTITEMYNQVRYKIADAIVNGKTLTIEGGNYKLCERRANCVGFKKCFRSKCKKLLEESEGM